MNYEKKKIEDIKMKYGLPCYVFDEEAFKDNYIHLETALQSLYPNYRVAFYYKNK